MLSPTVDDPLARATDGRPAEPRSEEDAVATGMTEVGLTGEHEYIDPRPEQSPQESTFDAAAAGDKQQDDDDVTVIVLEQNAGDSDGQRLTIAWNDQAGPHVEERRRAIMLRELVRVQRTSFLHFLILCLIPTVLLLIVIATVISEDEVCYSEATVCRKEARTFINAFTTRCVCEAIAVPRQG